MNNLKFNSLNAPPPKVMDRLVQLQQRKQRPIPPPIAEEEEDEDVADFYEYIPRRKGDFPPVSYEPPDNPPTATRYDIVDRVFDDDIPVYILRPHSTNPHDQEIAFTQSSESPCSSQPRHDGESERADLPGAITRAGSTSSRQTPASARSTPTSTLAYDPSDPALLRVDLFDIELYVTPRELEHYETYRFENPRPEDFPVTVTLSQTGSEVRGMGRERRAEERREINDTKPRRRPPKKKSRLGPVVVIEGAHGRPIAGSNALNASSRDGSEGALGRSPADLETLMDVDIDIAPSVEAPSVEAPTEEMDMLNMGNSPRGMPSVPQHRMNDQNSRTARSTRSTRSVSRLTSSGAEQQLPCNSSAQQDSPKRHGKLPSSLAQELHVPSLKRLANAPVVQSHNRSQIDGHNSPRSSTMNSRCDSRPRTQSTIETYLKAMSTAGQAKKYPSVMPNQQSPHNNSTPPEAGEKQHASNSGVGDLIDKIEVNEQDNDKEYHDISHIILHNDSRGVR